ncbi:MAG: hypothetical protein ACREGA_02080 [Candidatus Saccharimonadales bacterium]
MAKAKNPAAKRPAQPQTPSWNFVRPSLQLWRQHYSSLIVLVLLPLFVLQLGETLARGHAAGRQSVSILSFNSNLTLASSLIIIIGALWTIINAPALYYLLVQAAKGKNPALAACYRYGLKRFWRILGLRIAVFVIVAIGFILLIVPGVILLRRYYLANYYLIDQDLSIAESMRKSADESKPVSGYVYGTIGVTLVFALIAGVVSSILGAAGIIGTLISYVYLFAAALRYHEVALKQPSAAVKA